MCVTRLPYEDPARDVLKSKLCCLINTGNVEDAYSIHVTSDYDRISLNTIDPISLVADTIRSKLE